MKYETVMWAARRREPGCNSSSSYAKFADIEGCLNQWGETATSRRSNSPSSLFARLGNISHWLAFQPSLFVSFK